MSSRICSDNDSGRPLPATSANARSIAPLLFCANAASGKKAAANAQKAASQSSLICIEITSFVRGYGGDSTATYREQMEFAAKLDHRKLAARPNRQDFDQPDVPLL
jgi:hypothetical protein